MTARAAARATRAAPRHARPVSTAPRHREGDSAIRRVVSGNRPYVLAFFVLLAILTMMVVGPLQSYTAASERVDDLATKRLDLQRTVLQLENRRGRLQDPEEIEYLARQRLGLVKPGEIPYVVSGVDPDTDQVRPDGRPLKPVERPSVWRRLADAFGSLFSQ